MISSSKAQLESKEFLASLYQLLIHPVSLLLFSCFTSRPQECYEVEVIYFFEVVAS